MDPAIYELSDAMGLAYLVEILQSVQVYQNSLDVRTKQNTPIVVH